MANPSLDQIVTEAEQWFKDQMHNSVVSRDVAVFNHVYQAFEDLKARFAALFGAKPAPAPAPAAEAAPVPAAEADPAPADKSKPSS